MTKHKKGDLIATNEEMTELFFYGWNIQEDEFNLESILSQLKLGENTENRTTYNFIQQSYEMYIFESKAHWGIMFNEYGEPIMNLYTDFSKKRKGQGFFPVTEIQLFKW